MSQVRKRKGSVSDISSAEEEQRKRRYKRSRNAQSTPQAVNQVSAKNEEACKTEAVVNAIYNDLAAIAPQPQRVPLACQPKLFRMDQLIKDNIQMRSDCEIAQGKHAVSAASADLNALGGLAGDEKSHVQQASVDPYQNVLFLAKRDKLPLHEFYSDAPSTKGLDQEEFDRQLRMKLLQLPLLTADYESLLLAQGGPQYDERGVLRQFPLCMYKDKCVGMTEKFHLLTQPIILTALMYPREYQVFMKTGSTPSHNRPCILCCRHLLVDWCVECRELMMLGKTAGYAPDPDKAWEMKSTQVRQLYCNSVGIAGGYYAQDCKEPSPGEPLVMPLAKLNRTKLKAYRNKHGRWILDQTAIVWKPPQAPLPRAGESVESFYQGAGTQLRAYTTPEFQAFLTRQPFIEPAGAFSGQQSVAARRRGDYRDSASRKLKKDSSVDQDKNEFTERIPQDAAFWTIDRRLLEQWMRRDDLPPELSLQLANISDSIREVPLERKTVAWSQCRFIQVNTSLTLPVSHRHILDAGFFAALSTLHTPLTHILSKVINIRCQSRKFADVACNYMDEEERVDKKAESQHTPRIALQLQAIFECSLLGNFEHSKASTRLHGEARVVLQRLLRQPAGRAWFRDMVHRCSPLIVATLRDFMLFGIDADPALRLRLDRLMNLSKFHSIVQQNLNVVRQYVQSMLPLRTSCLRLALSSGINLCARRHARSVVVRDISILMQGSHAEILKSSFRRPNLHPHEFWPPMLKNYPMRKLPQALLNTENLSTSHDAVAPASQDSDSDSEDDLEGAAALVKKALKKNDQNARPPNNSAELDKPLLYLTEVQHKALRDLLLRLKPLETGILSRLIEHLHFFGVPRQTLRYVNEQIDHFHNSTLSIEQLKLKFAALQQHQPHCYNLLQLASSQVKQIFKHHKLYNLSLQTCGFQLDAARSRIPGLDFSRGVLHSSLHFVHCRVCGSIYSLLRDWHSVYRRQYRFGLRDALVEYLTGDIYCRRNKCTPLGKCRAQPLTKTPLLGKMLLFGGKMIMLCPQAGCCKPMVVDTELCAVTRRGIACMDCTKQLRQHPPGYVDLLAKYKLVNWLDTTAQQKSVIKCDICSAMLEKTANMYMLPREFYVCAHHKKPWMIRDILEAQASLPEGTKEQVLAAVAAKQTSRFTQWSQRAKLGAFQRKP